MVKYLLGVFVIIVVIFSCKKKDPATSQSSSTSTTGGTTTGTTGGTTTLSPPTGGEYCSLQTSYTYYDFNGTVTKDSSVFANFYAAPPSSVAPTNIYAGTVTLNGTDVPFSGSINSYYNSSPNTINIAGNLSWNVTGSGTVTAFSKSFTPVYPKYTGGNGLPDTCIKANGVTINITGVSANQNGVTVYLFQGSASAYKYLFTSTGSVTFSTSDLANFTTNQSVTILITVGNFYSATIGGIKRGFANIINYEKMSYLK